MTKSTHLKKAETSYYLERKEFIIRNISLSITSKSYKTLKTVYSMLIPKKNKTTFIYLRYRFLINYEYIVVIQTDLTMDVLSGKESKVPNCLAQWEVDDSLVRAGGRPTRTVCPK